MAERVYLDWNATALMRPQAAAALQAALPLAGNPSSVHAEGRAARHAIEHAREEVAALVGARAGDVVFTSSGTEANALALSPAIEISGEERPRDRLLISAIEHPSVRAGGRFPRDMIGEIAVDGDGRVSLAVLADAVVGTSRPLVSLMLANNETGVIQPVVEAAQIVHAAGGLLHVDAVQAAGRVPCDIAALGADLLTVSAHKIGGPKGTGALVRAREGIHLADPLIRGGGQERGLRAGTENVAGIAAFGAAAATVRQRRADEASHMLALRDLLERELRAISPQVVVFGSAAERLPNTTLFALEGIKAETVIIAFDLEGIALSSGAACSSGKVQPSHVLAAMGVSPPLARGAVRLSLGWTTTEADIERFLAAWRKVSSALSKGCSESKGAKDERGMAA
ncbi:MAG TPA: cysteine desulfurase family protein [Xanthobacteraceae bacterium]|nr:cysteine desulfurase family protein [Xanthobacteraceae bacterium]HXX03920.1 cysteine desulfurase family protein [Xanthobacteraceae bacterium]